MARASLVPAMDLAALTAAARRVVVGEVLSVSSAWDREHRRIYTTIELQVAESWKGPALTSGRLTVVQLGGVVGDVEMRVHGLSVFRPGDRSVLFLAGEDRAAHVVGLGQGRRPLRFDSVRKRWWVDGGDRSAAFARGPHGELQPAGVEGGTALEDLRAQVRGLVGR